ncbi:MAG: hydrogenase maturation protease [Frankiaceae bacterium]
MTETMRDERGTKRPNVLVLGVGNESFTDEGLGAVAARRIARRPVPGVEVVVGRAPGLSLTEVIEDRDCVLLLDALQATGSSPGDVVVLRDEEVRGAQHRLLSIGPAGIAEALDAAERAGRAPRHLAAVGMVPNRLDGGYGLSEAVWVRLVELVGTARAMLREWEVPDA